MALPIFPLSSIGLLLIVAAIMAIITRRLGMPYSAGLVAAGILISFVPNRPDLPLSRDLVFNILLPPLVFEAALQLEWRQFRRELPVTLILAFLGVAVASAFVTAGMHWLLGWSWMGSGLFGVLIAATDPVAVIAAFREMKAERRLSIIVESESLLNDGVAAVGFAVLAAIAVGQSTSAAIVIPLFLWTLFGGVLIGALITGALLYLAGRTEDYLVEVTLTTIAAWGSFLTAEYFHASGILAALTAGLMVGNLGSVGSISVEGRSHLIAAWEYFAFVANSFVFFEIGIHSGSIPLGTLGWVEGGIAILLVIIGRLVTVYPISGAFRASKLKIPLPYQHILFWGGLRGALALALALAVPASVPERASIIVTAFLVVAFSIFVQGLTTPWLVQHFGLARKPVRERVAEAEAAP